MTSVSRLIVVQSNEHQAQALRYAFERRGTRVDVIPANASREDMSKTLRPAATKEPDETSSQVIVAGADTAGDALDLLGQLRRAVDAAGLEAPILYLGNGVSRDDALTLGATEVMPLPAHLRDVVTLAQIVTGAKRKAGDIYLSQLDFFDGVFDLIRAVCATKRSAVLTLVRGLRRGEVRFFAGEVTSAQVSMMHGLAAFHHLLLWRTANFELRWEDVVRRQQIPMEPDELLSDARRFLAEVEEVVTDIELAGAYKQVDSKVAATRLPEPIDEIVGLMDGSRTIPDVVEDSSYRTFDTLRMANRLAREGFIERMAAPAKSFSFQIGGGLGDWLLGRSGGKPETGQTRTASDEGDAEVEMITIDWSDVLPSSHSTDDGLAQVVPAAVAAGEITVARRAATDSQAGSAAAASAVEREGLETITSAAQRDRLFALAEADEHGPDSDAGADMAAQPGEEAGADAEAQPGEEAGADVEAQPGEEHELSAEQEEPDKPMNQDSSAAEPDKDSADTPAKNETESESKQAFTETEEQFFRDGAELASKPAPPVESFADLDKGYEPQTFWQRFFGRGKPRQTRLAKSAAPAARSAAPASKSAAPAAESAAPASKSAAPAETRGGPGKPTRTRKKRKKR